MEADPPDAHHDLYEPEASTTYGSRWWRQDPLSALLLYRPPPFVRSADLRREVVVVSNPALRGAALGGYQLRDGGERHTFVFPDGFVLGPWRSVEVFCAPGALPPSDGDTIDSPVRRMWRKRDGGLRKAHVLNDDGETMHLCDPSGEDVARLTTSADGTRVFALPALAATKAVAFGAAELRLAATAASVAVLAVWLGNTVGLVAAALFVAAADAGCAWFRARAVPRGAAAPAVVQLADHVVAAGALLSLLGAAPGLSAVAQGGVKLLACLEAASALGNANASAKATDADALPAHQLAAAVLARGRTAFAVALLLVADQRVPLALSGLTRAAAMAAIPLAPVAFASAAVKAVVLWERLLEKPGSGP